MFRVMVAPDFEITPADPDFPPALLHTMKTARDVTGSNYVSFWANMGDSDLLSSIVATTYPAPWLRQYVEKDYMHIDPIITRGMNSVGAIIFDHAHPETVELADFAADALAHGIGARTVGIPVHVGANIRSVVTFATDLELAGDSDDTSALMTKFREQANIVAVAVTERFLNSRPARHNLTNREIEVLYWGSCGKTDQQTADIMGLSRWTVVAHVQSAKSKLRVRNKAAAIARALTLKLFQDFDHKL